jgi:eukaryotic-like serine/threonine-protein kinase
VGFTANLTREKETGEGAASDRPDWNAAGAVTALLDLGGGRYAAGSRDGISFDAATGWSAPTRGRVHWLLPLPDGFVASGVAGRLVVRSAHWHDLATGDTGEVRAGALAPDGRTLFTAGDDGVIRSWHLPADLRARGAMSADGPVTAVGIHPEGRSFAVATERAVTLRFGTQEEQPGPDGRAFATLRVLGEGPAGGTAIGVELRGGTVVVSELAGGREIGEKARFDLAEGATAVSAHLSADGMRVAVGDDRGRVFVWNVLDRTALAAIDSGQRRPIDRVALSADGMLVAAPTAEDKVGVWAVGDSTLRLSVPADDQTVFRFVPGGARLAAAGRGGAIRVWNVTTGRQDLVLHGHVGRVRALGASPDGRTLASGGATGEVKLWDLRTGQELLGLRRHPGPVSVVEFAPNGRLLVTAGTHVAVWEIRE